MPHKKTKRKNKKIKSYRCPKNKIYNPKTKKCIPLNTPLGQNLKNKKITTIGGPISFHYYKFIFNKIERKIILFGDEHTRYELYNQSHIIHITSLLKK